MDSNGNFDNVALHIFYRAFALDIHNSSNVDIRNILFSLDHTELCNVVKAIQLLEKYIENNIPDIQAQKRGF